MIAPMAVAYPDEILRSVADRMAAHGVGVIPVVDRADSKHLRGLITQFDLLRPARSSSKRSGMPNECSHCGVSHLRFGRTRQRRRVGNRLN